MLSERVVLLTGAGGGIGTVLCRRLLNERATVIASDLDKGALDRLAKEMSSDRLHCVRTDVADERSCAELADFAKSAAGRVDILVNNAGLFPPCAFEEMTFQEWRRIISVNLDSLFLMTRAILPLLKGRGWGRIINMGSGSVFLGTPRNTHYVAAKAGVIGFSRSLAREIGGYGITVNVITPGLTSTAAVLELNNPEFLENRRMQRAIPRHQQPEDLVGAVMFLASDASDFMTGQILNVDGGANMH